MKHEKSCGAVVYRRHRGLDYFLILKHVSGQHWCLPKGHGNPEETEEQTARREIFEETGLVTDLKPGFTRVITYNPKPGVLKEVVFFLAKVKKRHLMLQADEILNGVWLELDDALKLCTHSTTADVLKDAQAHLLKRRAAREAQRG